ncbi:unnamed protein product [Adineta steineri]|uniref:NHL repeat containing protein n=1 Tax=Adineta steineri TaxID=433720 RepID=A0A814HRZ2_9BILA|nr:unnamed protein product [Adineta steineri]CAF1251914.1 unnamed protein product [Adineta steineri]
MESNKVNVYNGVHLTNAAPRQRATPSAYYDTGKLTRVLFSILVLILSLAVLAIALLTKKINEENISISEGSIIEATTTTEMIIPDMIEITTKELLMPSVIINTDTKWKQNAITVAGGYGRGNKLNQLNDPYGICINDDDNSIYIADRENHRIVKWQSGAYNGEIVAGGNGRGSAIHQLNYPKDVILDKGKNNIIICDQGNSRIIRSSLQNSQNQRVLIVRIVCCSLAMDDNEDLYISDWAKHQVIRWRQGDKEGKVVAGGNDKGNRFDQFNQPSSIFVDKYYSIYVADCMNNRVMKWSKNATIGIPVAHGQLINANLSSLLRPNSVIVDHMGNIYMSNERNHQITRWSPGTTKGVPVVGGRNAGSKSMELSYPFDLSFDRQGNLYVVDAGNDRIQKFIIDRD